MAREIQNKIDLIAPRHSMSANACNAIALNEDGDADQYISIPLNHTLGTEIITNGDFENGSTDWTLYSGWSVVDGKATYTYSGVNNKYCYQASPHPRGTRFLVEYDIEVTTGTLYAFVGPHQGVTALKHVRATGEIATSATFNFLGMYGKNGISGGGYFDNYSVKTITFETLAILYLDNATGSHVSVSQTWSDIEYKITSSFSNLVTLAVIPTEADLTLLDANPNLLFQLVKGDLTTGLSFTASDVQNLWLGNEGRASGQRVYNALAFDSSKELSPNYFTYNVTGVTAGSGTSSVYTGSYLGGLVTRCVQNGQSAYSYFVVEGLTVGETYTASIQLLYSSGSFRTTWIRDNISKTSYGTILPSASLGERSIEFVALTSEAQFVIGGSSNYNAYTVTKFPSVILSSDINSDGYLHVDGFTNNCRTFFVNEASGVSNFKLAQDTNGIAIDYLEDGTIGYAHSDDRNLPMSLYLNLERYRFTEVVGGAFENYGPNLVTNDFSENISGVVNLVSCSVSWNSAHGGCLQATNAQNGQYAYAKMTVTGLEVGKTYKAYAELVGDYGTTLATDLRDASDDSYYGQVITADVLGGNLITFVARSTEAYFKIGADNSWSGYTLTKNYFIKELLSTDERIDYRVLEHNTQHLGDNLVTNSYFASNADGWAGATGASVAHDATNQRLECTVIDSSGSKVTTNPTSMGADKTFKLTFDLEYGTYTGADVAIYWSALVKATVQAGVEQEVIFTTTSDTSQIGFGRSGVGSAGTFFIDNVTLEEISEVNTLYVNGAVDTTTPELPDPTTPIVQGDTAIIGYPHTVKRRYKAVNLDDPTLPNVLSTDIKTAQDAADEFAAWVAARNAWILANKDIIEDEFGNPWVNEHGLYYYE